ncbi:MAG TPA: RNA-binding S4 domain-containing protein [Sulfurimonas sp.]|nr:RNA-binding S4 domain-containing protein [Sulfurimonas sp.]
MRIDKFLNSVNITKRRTVAQDMISNGVVSINGKVVKASKNVEVGNEIELAYLKGSKKYLVLLIPTMKSTPKSDQDKYIKETT